MAVSLGNTMYAVGILWCTYGGHRVPKREAVRTSRGRLVCPIHKFPLRTKSRLYGKRRKK